MSIDAMQQALEALEAINEMSKPPMNIPLAAEIDGAMDALRQAIEQAEKQEKLCKYCGGIGRVVCDGKCMPEQEPVAWMEDSIEFYAKDHPTNSCTIPLYTAPPKREWVGLTDEEIVACGWCDLRFARAIEAKLKERNNG
jgi:hypothetical protein